MKHLTLLAITFIVLAAVGCNETPSTAESDTTSDTSPQKPREPKMYDYTPSYSANFVAGSVEATETVMSLYRAWDDNKLDDVAGSFSDSVNMYFWDGSELVTTKDSMKAAMKSYRDNYSSMETKLNAVVSVKESEKNEEWVLVWLNEIRKDKSGKVDSTQMQETWGLDKNGKVRTLYQYGQTPAKPKK